MENSKTKLSKGLKRLLAATIFVAVAFLGCFIALAFVAKGANDPDLKDFGMVMKYHLKGLLDLLLFKYANLSNIAYFALSVFVYALFVCWVIFFIAGVFINDRKNTKIMVHAVILSFISYLLYLVMASGSQKYWLIMNSRAPFDQSNTVNTVLMILTLAMVGLTAAYFVLSILFYFWCVCHSFLASKEQNNEEEYVYDVENMEAKIRRIMQEELLNNQPFKVYIVNDKITLEEQSEEEPVKEEEPLPEPVPEPEPEPVKEPEPEPVKEEPKRVWPQVNFWEIAREVFPAFDNPKPLPKEEKVIEVQPQQEENEEWNRNKRQPFITRIITADTDIKVNYNEIKNEILSYGVKARLSRGGETFRLKEKSYVKIYLVGKTLKVYLALSPEDYKDSPIPVEDVGHRPNYAEMPLLFKVRSGLSVRRCKELVKAAMEKDGLTQGEVLDTNWVDELRKINAEKAKNKKA